MAGGGMRRRGMIAEINVTPLVDIMLVLLIVFMLTAHLIAKQAIEVDLPKASQATTPPPTPLVVTLSREGDLYLNGIRVSAADLRAGVAAEVAKDPKNPPTVIVAGDKDVSHGRVVWVLDTLKSLGIVAFAIQIDPTELVAPTAP